MDSDEGVKGKIIKIENRKLKIQLKLRKNKEGLSEVVLKASL